MVSGCLTGQSSEYYTTTSARPQHPSVGGGPGSDAREVGVIAAKVAVRCRLDEPVAAAEQIQVARDDSCRAQNADGSATNLI